MIEPDPKKKPDQPYKIWQGAPYVLVIVAVVVLILMFIAWAMPAATPRTLSTPLPGTQITPTQPPVVIGTPMSTTFPEPTAENVGYANGIIGLSGLLTLILILGALREILYYRKKEKQASHQQENLDV